MLVASALGFLLTGSALAQPGSTAPSPVAPAPRTPFKLKLAVTDTNESRSYELVLLDDSCGGVDERAGDRRDEIKICAHPSPLGARLVVGWKLHTKTLDHEVNYEAVVVKGKTVEVGRTNGARFSLSVI